MDDPKTRFRPSADDEEVETNEPTRKEMTRSAKPPAAVPAIDPAMAQMFATMIASAMAPIVDALQAITSGQNEAALQAIEAAKRPKRPESYKGDFPYHEKSHFRPEGIDGPALPPLDCETWLGIYETDEGTGELVIRTTYQYLADEHGGCTLEERQLLNRITAGVYPGIRRRDQQTGIVRVQMRHDADGSAYRKIIAVPKTWQTKQTKNLLGGVDFLSQLVTRETVAA